jgi:hypothetical protein
LTRQPVEMRGAAGGAGKPGIRDRGRRRIVHLVAAPAMPNEVFPRLPRSARTPAACGPRRSSTLGQDTIITDYRSASRSQS